MREGTGELVIPIGTEIMAGFHSVNMSSFMDLGVKFILLNGPRLIAPWSDCAGLGLVCSTGTR
jgi:hypothetical protein